MKALFFFEYFCFALSGIADALVDFFRIKQIPISVETENILDAFIKNKILKKSPGGWSLPDALSFLVRHEPDRVLTLTKQLVEAAGQDFADMRTALSADSGRIMDIALTLHNLGPEYQSEGLDLFEHMLEIEAYQASEILREIDGDPRPVANDDSLISARSLVCNLRGGGGYFIKNNGIFISRIHPPRSWEWQ